MSTTPTDLAALTLEHAQLMSQAYCEFYGVPDEIIGCSDEQLIAWAADVRTDESRHGVSNVAIDYPARREVDSRGERVWFKPAIRDSSETWGWTADPAQAHPDYQVKIGGDGSLVTWVGDPWAHEPRCVNCHRLDCHGGPLCVPERAALPNDCRASCESNCPPGRCLWAENHRAIPATTTTKGTDMPTKTKADPVITEVTDTTGEDLPGISLPGDPEADEPRFTEWMRYPLPPAPPRLTVTYDGYGRYKLPSPTTGRPTGFSRATTIAKTLEETYNLSRWSRRQAVKAIIAAVQAQNAISAAAAQGNINDFDVAGDAPTPLSVLGDVIAAIDAEDDRALDKAVDLLDNITGGADARELGEAVHAWLEAVDIGIVLPSQVPDMFQPYVVAARDALRRAGLVPVAEYVERIVLNDRGEETVVGTIDRIYLCVTTGELIMGDVKTSKTLEYSWLPYSVQVGGVYGYATKMFHPEGDTSQGEHGWLPMPEINDKFAVILHVPSDQPERSAVVTIDRYFGGESMVASLDTRKRRKEAKSRTASVHDIPVPSKDALKYVEARDAVLNVTDAAQLSDVWERYQAWWTQDLTELGEHVAQLLDNAAASATA